MRRITLFYFLWVKTNRNNECLFSIINAMDDIVSFRSIYQSRSSIGLVRNEFRIPNLAAIMHCGIYFYDARDLRMMLHKRMWIQTCTKTLVQCLWVPKNYIQTTNASTMHRLFHLANHFLHLSTKYRIPNEFSLYRKDLTIFEYYLGHKRMGFWEIWMPTETFGSQQIVNRTRWPKYQYIE